MKKFYRLCNFQFLNVGIMSFLVCAALLIFQLSAFSGQSFDSGVRLEQFMQRSGFDMMFLSAFVLILAIIAVSVYSKYFGSKSIYTILSLPVSRTAIYLSFIIPGIVAVLILCFTQIISVHLCYQIVLNKLTIAVADDTVKVEYMSNAVFLAFVRYNYLRFLLPLDVFDLFRSLCLLTAPVISLIYFAFCERVRKFGGMVLVLLQIIMLWQIIAGMNNTSSNNSFYTLIVYVCLSFILTGLSAFLSYRMIKNREVV